LAIDKVDKIDSVWLAKDGSEVMVAVFDHLPWESNTEEHLLLLQEKLDTYLAFIESGQLIRMCPRAKTAPVAVEVAGLYDLSKDAKDFYAKAKRYSRKVGAELRFKLFVPEEATHTKRKEPRRKVKGGRLRPGRRVKGY
jgi:hypothetical protein